MNPFSPPMPPLSVAILGATGAVGQRFLTLLADHPWFEVTRLVASPRSAGKPYGQAVNWVLDTPLPPAFAHVVVKALPAPDEDLGDVRLAFSALDTDTAIDVEQQLAAAGVQVFSNASSHRMDPGVPLVIPEINPDHLALGGRLVTNPNCSTIGLVLAIGPVQRVFGMRRVSVVTEQALSGAGLVNGAPLQLQDNVVPFISGEEQKIASETGKLLGTLVQGSGECRIRAASFAVSATCTRVPVRDGHLLCVSMEIEEPATREQLLATWGDFRGLPQELDLPSAPHPPLVLLDAHDAPQPALHRDLQSGMAASIGRLRPDTLYGEPEDLAARRGWKFITLSHNTLRGAAGGSVLNAELWWARGRNAAQAPSSP